MEVGVQSLREEIVETDIAYPKIQRIIDEKVFPRLNLGQSYGRLGDGAITGHIWHPFSAIPRLGNYINLYLTG